jgi:hypothetical protein
VIPQMGEIGVQVKIEGKEVEVQCDEIKGQGVEEIRDLYHHYFSNRESSPDYMSNP